MSLLSALETGVGRDQQTEVLKYLQTVYLQI